MEFSNVDWDKYKRLYQENNIVRIENVLEAKTCAQLQKVVSSDIEFSSAFVHNGRVVTATDRELAALSESNKQNVQREIYENAGKGVGFVYGTYKVNQEPQVNSTLSRFHQWLNSTATLDTIMRLSGVNGLKSATCQATRYRPGDFLTRHNDHNEQEARKLAYVFNLTEKWHPDWGACCNSTMTPVCHKNLYSLVQ